MDIKHIEIDVEDNWRYTQLALLVDRDDFLRDLYKIRQTLHLAKPISSDKLFEYEVNEMKRRDFVKRRSAEVKVIAPYRSDCLRSESLVFDLVRKYKRSDSYFHAIYAAVITGKIQTENLPTNTASCELIFPEYYYHQVKLGNKDPQIAILLSPESSRNDVIEAYREGFQKVLEEYRHRMRAQYRNPLFVDTISNIKRDREWYWLNKQGMSYGQIANLTNKQRRVISTDGVIKAIKQYKKNLKIPISTLET